MTFLFERPADTTSLVLELFAFAEGTTDFSRTDALLGGQCGVTLRDDEKSITVDAIPLKAIAGKEGFVSLKVTAPANCTLDIDDEAKSLFTLGGTTPDYTLVHKGGGIPSGSYPIKFIVTTKSGTTFHVPETVNVYPGMTTDAWYGGAADAPLEIPALADKVFFVRGSGAGWYSAHDELKNIGASDSNAGTYLSPLATIQRAIDTVIAVNDGSSEYTIYIDGDLTLASAEQAGANGMADFSALDKPLSLTIKPLLTDAEAKSTLNASSLARVMCASPATGGSLVLTLERLVLTGGNVSGDGGGIYISGGTFSAVNSTIKNCNAKYGGGVYVDTSETAYMESVTVSGCSAEKGSGAYVVADKSLTVHNPLFEDGANDVYLESGAYVKMAIDSSSSYNRITITPAVYASRKKVAETIWWNAGVFRVMPEENGTKWAVNIDGTLMHGELSTVTEDEIKASEVYMNEKGWMRSEDSASYFTKFMFFVTSEGVYGVLKYSGSGRALDAECRLVPDGTVNTFTMKINDNVDLDTGTVGFGTTYDFRLGNVNADYYNGAKGVFLQLAD